MINHYMTFPGDDIGSKICLWGGTGTKFYGMGIQNNTFEFYIPAVGDYFKFWTDRNATNASGSYQTASGGTCLSCK